LAKAEKIETMKQWHCGDYQLEIGRKTYLMGIVNATPDSFSGDGTSSDKAIARALQMVEAGADILDIGGESTRPGAPKISLDEELNRVLPIISELARQVNIPISIDTTKSEVAKLAVENGASIVNDISGATFQEDMLDVCAPLNCGVVLMHLRGTPQSMGWSENAGGSSDVIEEVLDFWSHRIIAAQLAGIEIERLCLDAGFGFGKSVEENIALIRRGRELNSLGIPTLSGTSRKSTIGRILDNAPVEERLFGTAAAVALAIQNGADVVRVHDVKAMRDVVKVSDAICR
jgi:dihydropteroate synthase